jgi:hypothetical protein
MSWRDRIANAILGGKVGGPTPSGIHVYHSSPHDFDRFDLGKIGTGEGAQVYGHGIYAAENPAVSGQGGQYWGQFLNRFPKGDMRTAEYLKQHGFDRDAAAASLRAEIARQNAATPYGNLTRDVDSSHYDKLRERLDLLESGGPVGPRTYEVNFKAKPEELLDWDKPLPQQSPQVRGAMKNVESNLVRHWLADPDVYQSARGENIYEQLVGKHGKAEASAHLTDLGIPGIRYLDEGSRMYDPIANAMVDKFGSRAAALEVAQQRQKQTAFGDLNKWDRTVNALSTPQTHNYVAFDPSRLDIMAKYGVVGGVPLGALAATDQYGERQ